MRRGKKQQMSLCGIGEKRRIAVNMACPYSVRTPTHFMEEMKPMKRNIIHFAVGLLAALGMIRQADAETDSGLSNLNAFKIADFYNRGSEADAVVPVGHCDQIDCGDGCCKKKCCRPKRGFYVGMETTFLSPTTDGSSTRVDITDIGGGTTNSYFGENNDDVIVGPRIWLGVQGDKWGVQARYWELDDTAASVVPFGATAGSTSLDVFEAYTLDFELTRKFCRRQTDMVASFGVRHARLSNFNSVSATELVGADLQTASAWTNREMDGTGVTTGLSGLRRIRCSNWSVFWNARGSLLWGDADVRVETSAVGIGPGGSTGSVNGAVANSDETLFIGEFQLGLQRDYKLKCLPATAFFRGAFEYQVWDIDSNSTAGSNSFAVLGGTSASDANAAATAQETTLVGFTLGTGLYW